MPRAAPAGVTAPSLARVDSHRAGRDPVVVRGTAHEPVAGNDDPREPLEVLARADPLVGVLAVARAAGAWLDRRDRIGQVADELPDRIGRQREVGLEDSRECAGLAVDRAGEPHHPRALGARRVGDVRLSLRVRSQVVDQAQVRALDRLNELAGRLDHHRRGQRQVELPVRVRATGAALHEQVARTLG